MNWNQAMEDDRRALRRIGAFCFLFAWMAWFSCALPASARSYMLGVLRRAETRARDFVVVMAEDYGVSVPARLFGPPQQDDDTPADAVRLAQNFRALAALLDLLLDHYPGGRNCRIHDARWVMSGWRVVTLLAAPSRLLADIAARQLRHAASIPVARLDSS